ncbi:FHA domain-containing protein [Streptomyces roseochromogenus]|uniref:FHA domain-containing protein n=1 Tax=Streptomyces roseochromogenus TaxID=285450 RepID=UPI003CC91F08
MAGPDAGGVHLLHGGRITVGRSGEADVPLDDPDVSRLHCAVTVGADGRVSVADLGSTNGTVLDGGRVGERPVRFPAGGLLRIGESALRVASAGGRGCGLSPTGRGVFGLFPRLRVRVRVWLRVQVRVRVRWGIPGLRPGLGSHPHHPCGHRRRVRVAPVGRKRRRRVRVVLGGRERRRPVRVVLVGRERRRPVRGVPVGAGRWGVPWGRGSMGMTLRVGASGVGAGASAFGVGGGAGAGWGAHYREPERWGHACRAFRCRRIRIGSRGRRAVRRRCDGTRAGCRR